MTDEEYDEMMDSLSLHAQNQVLKHFGQEPVKPEKEKRHRKRYLFWPFFVMSFLFAMPFVAVGCILCATIVGIPLGVPIMFFGCIPFSWVNISYQKYRLRNGLTNQKVIKV